MIKKIVIGFILLLLICNIPNISASFQTQNFGGSVEVTAPPTNIDFISSGFGGSVVIPSETPSTVSFVSSSFGGEVDVDTYGWGIWSPYWRVGTFPSDVDNFNASSYNSSAINLTWSIGDNITHAYVRYSKTTYPTGRTEGIFLVNTTNSSYNHTGLHLGTQYYYSAWGYNSTDNTYSETYSTSTNFTNPGSPNSLQDTGNTTTSISFSWTTGTNASSTIVYHNATGVTNYPNSTNGVEVINTAGSTGTVTGLVANTTYYFTAYSYNPSSNLYSESNSTDIAMTAAQAGDVSSLSASRFNDTQINISWVKANNDDDVVVLRKTGTYPTTQTDGTIVYNGSLLSTIDTGLTPATKYYYRAWAWNGEDFGTGYASDTQTTRPESPQNFTGDIENNTLIINWTKGTGATTTLIRNNTGAYPVNTSDGYLVYNGTGITTTVPGISSVDYYRGWSYVVVDGESIYSLPVNLLWGGLEINVYKQDEPHIEIGNYTVFITNSDASETYQNTSCNNPFRIDVSDVPNGVDITVQIIKQGYETTSQVMDLFENAYYTVNFYLPASSEGSPGGESSEDWYVNASDPDNETFASHYIITVEDELGEGIGNSYVTIQAYINTTDTYETVLSDYTDTAGQIEVDLIPDTVYYVEINHDSGDYENTSTYWTPSEVVYVEDAYKTFVLEFAEVTPHYPDNPFESIDFTAEIGGTNLYVNYTDSTSETINASVYVYMENLSTNDTTFFDSYNDTTNSTSFNTIFTSINNSNCYIIRLFYNHSYWGSQTTTLSICGTSVINPPTSDTEIRNMFDALYGGMPFGWHNFLIFIFLVLGMFYADERDAGKILVILGGLFLFLNIWVGFNSNLATVASGIIPTLFIAVGIIVIWNDSRRREAS